MRKLIALLLAICLVFGALPVSLAEGFETPEVPISDETGIYISINIVGYNNAVIAKKTSDKVENNCTALKAVTSLLKKEGVSYTLKGNYISEIGGLKEFDYGKNSGWMYTVNGIYPSVAMNQFILSEGDKLEMKYVVSYDEHDDSEDPSNPDTPVTPVQPVRKSIKNAIVSGITMKNYTAKEVKQSLHVTLGGTKLTEGKDYTVSYENNVKVGTASVIITGIGSYTDSVKKNFSIVLAKPVVKVVKVSTAAVALKWSKVPGAKYYRVYEYNTKTKKYVPIAKTAALTYSVKKLAAGSTHYFLVRAYFLNKAGAQVGSLFEVKDCVKGVVLCKAPSVKAAASGKTVTLKWAKVSGVKFYRVYEYNAKTKKYTTLLKSTTKLSAKLAKQKAGTHYYLVRAFNASSQGSVYTLKNLVKVKVK